MMEWALALAYFGSRIAAAVCWILAALVIGLSCVVILVSFWFLVFFELGTVLIGNIYDVHDDGLLGRLFSKLIRAAKAMGRVE